MSGIMWLAVGGIVMAAALAVAFWMEWRAERQRTWVWTDDAQTLDKLKKEPWWHD